MKSLVFKIEGMHCEGCAETIRALVEREPGVKNTDVSFKNSEARILFDTQATSEERLVATIQKPGFKVVERR